MFAWDRPRGPVCDLELGVDGREAFTTPSSSPPHHLYLCPSDPPPLANSCRRDYVRSRPVRRGTHTQEPLRWSSFRHRPLHRGKTDMILRILQRLGGRRCLLSRASLFIVFRVAIMTLSVESRPASDMTTLRCSRMGSGVCTTVGGHVHPWSAPARSRQSRRQATRSSCSGQATIAQGGKRLTVQQPRG